MAAQPILEWLNGEPPPAHITRNTGASVTLSIGALMTQPGRWAWVSVGPIGSSVKTYRRHHCEYAERTIEGERRVFARYVGPKEEK